MSAVDRHHNDHAHVTRADDDDDEQTKTVQIKTEAAAAAAGERTPFLVSDILTAAAEESAEGRHMAATAAANGFEATAAAAGESAAGVEAVAAAEGAMTPNNADAAGAGYAAGSPDEAGGELGTESEW